MTTLDRCLLCIHHDRTRPAAPGFATCNRCSDDIRDDLAEIRDRYAMLDPYTPSQQADQSQTGKVRASKSPCNDHRLGMMDPRSTTTGRAYSAPATLGTWARALEEDTGQRVGDFGVPSLVRYLLDMHAHITRQPWVDEYAREIHELVEALRPETGEDRPKWIGRCRTLVDEGECGTDLYAPRYGDTIKCRGCKREWTRPEWLRLGKLLEAS